MADSQLTVNVSVLVWVGKILTTSWPQTLTQCNTEHRVDGILQTHSALFFQ